MPRKVIVGKPACDWITLTSRKERDEGRMLAAFWEMSRCHKETPKAARQMQFKGVAIDGAFVGLAEVEGTEAENRMTMYRAWGEIAQDSLEELSESPISRCTRVDLQVTIPQPFDYRARNLADSLDKAEWFGKPRKSRLYEDNGLDTVYIGSRTSDRVIRIYVKDIDGLRWLRFEVEYHGDRASAVYQKCYQGNAYIMGGILRSELDSLPEVADVGIVELGKALDYHSVTISAPDRVSQPHGLSNWLLSSVEPAIKRGINDHDEGYKIRETIRRWMRLVEEFDEGEKIAKIAGDFTQF